MQRLYSMFPDRGPGLGLLLLRVDAALVMLLDPQGGWLAGVGPWPMRVAWGAAVLLACGWLTPLALVLGLLVTIARLPEPAGWAVLLLLLSVLLLGPGAYSLDAHLYGRRVLRRPPREDD
ncbi:hypothetical protein ARC20_00935 [Stenotrophomonas panacihumi]|uniref:Transmembrane protein n=1 Tax=Stenotrophomonas panacihumi TaxID=676599 RepID=A0A0R0AEE2_9GAMM|nr:hypothetical protein [Stenotrophomonas panacihumi]KRG43324.1 hypothetical protein ARC20_00935 [Stenotrophomonas panacihumi]PTN55917.1 hypothetical protein C9J98_03415 [Stenotrophomonas panacihumi]